MAEHSGVLEKTGQDTGVTGHSRLIEKYGPEFGAAGHGRVIEKDGRGSWQRTTAGL